MQKGKRIDNRSREFIIDGLGANRKKVEAKRHTALSGPPGVGKSYGTIEECRKNNVNYIHIAPGTSDIVLITKIAIGVYKLKKNEELVVIFDDADDMIFGTYADLNKWKIAMAKPDPSIGFIPSISHQVDMGNTMTKLEKQGKTELITALQSFMSDEEIGITIPTDRCRFIILCNLDLEDPKAFKGKLKSAVPPVLDRLRYDRITMGEDEQWGWLAHVLGQSQPFPGYPLKPDQKIELLNWIKPYWSRMRSTSYRAVEEMAEAMINNPKTYEDLWLRQLKSTTAVAK